MKKEPYFNITQILIFTAISFLIFVLGWINVFNPFRDVVISIFGDVYINTKNKIIGFEEFSKVFDSISDVRNENKELKEKNVELESKIVQLETSLNDVSFVLEKGLVNFDSDKESIPARVLGYEENLSGIIYINKGQMDGVVQSDLAVIGDFVLGEVTKTYTHYSEVKLIGTSDYKLNVVTIENETRGILIGTLGSEMQVTEILNDKPLNVGDTFITEGKDNKYPTGLYVGRVKRIIGSQAEPTKIAVLENNLNFKDLDRLYIIKAK
jgi:rod shape-determining protein MreC